MKKSKAIFFILYQLGLVTSSIACVFYDLAINMSVLFYWYK